MSTLKEMYPGIPFSPPTTLTASISNSDTEIYIEDSGCLPDAPNYATLGVDENAEVIFYREKELGLLKDCVRAVEGNAKSWPYGTEVARHFTESDYEALIGNVNLLGAVSKRNTSDINERIKKFFTNNMGETSVTDSDDGYMRNVVFGGKSVQDAEPTPEAPQEIKSVENVGAKVTGAQLFDANRTISAKTYAKCFVVDNTLIVTSDNSSDANCQRWLRWDYDVSEFSSMADLTLSVGSITKIGDVNPKILFRTLDESGNLLTDKELTENTSVTASTNGAKTVRIILYATNNTPVSEGDGAIYESVMLRAVTQAVPWQPYTEQTLTIPHTLRGLPVSEGGNFTDKNGQQWICDEVDVERGVLVKRTSVEVFDGSSDENWFNDGTQNTEASRWGTDYLASKMVTPSAANILAAILSSHYPTVTASNTYGQKVGISLTAVGKMNIYDSSFANSTKADWTAHLADNPLTVQYALLEPIEIPLSKEEVEAYKALATHYGGTNIFFDSANGIVPNVNFDYPCALDSFVEYIKAQMGDTREFVYDMDSRISDDEILSALAYVNSEYAAALLELEV